MRVRLQLLSGQELSWIEADPGWTISQLRKAIREQEALGSMTAISLMLGHRMLSQDMYELRMPDCGIQDSTALTIVVHDGFRILTPPGKIWNAATGECMQTLSGHQESAAETSHHQFSQDGALALTVSTAAVSSDRIVKIWSTATGGCLQTLMCSRTEIDAVFSPGGVFLLLSSRGPPYAKIWNTASGECVPLLGHTEVLSSKVFSPDGVLALTASWDCTCKVWTCMDWTCKDWTCIRTLYHNDEVNSAVFSQDGALVLSASFDSTAKIWGAISGKCLQTFSGPGFPPESAKFSHDGALVLTASQDGTAKVWNSISGECIQTLTSLPTPVGRDGICTIAVFSQDGALVLVVSEDATAKIFRTASGECIQSLSDSIRSFRDPQHGVTGHFWRSAAFLLDDTVVLMWSDKTVKIWETASGKCVQTLQTHGLNQYSPDNSPWHEYISISEKL